LNQFDELEGISVLFKQLNINYDPVSVITTLMMI